MRGLDLDRRGSTGRGPRRRRRDRRVGRAAPVRPDLIVEDHESHPVTADETRPARASVAHREVELAATGRSRRHQTARIEREDHRVALLVLVQAQHGPSAPRARRQSRRRGSSPGTQSRSDSNSRPSPRRALAARRVPRAPCADRGPRAAGSARVGRTRSRSCRRAVRAAAGDRAASGRAPAPRRAPRRRARAGAASARARARSLPGSRPRELRILGARERGSSSMTRRARPCSGLKSRRVSDVRDPRRRAREAARADAGRGVQQQRPEQQRQQREHRSSEGRREPRAAGAGGSRACPRRARPRAAPRAPAHLGTGTARRRRRSASSGVRPSTSEAGSSNTRCRRRAATSPARPRATRSRVHREPPAPWPPAATEPGAWRRAESELQIRPRGAHEARHVGQDLVAHDHPAYELRAARRAWQARSRAAGRRPGVPRRDGASEARVRLPRPGSPSRS